jgi:flagellar hook assembly protein FlgD
MTTQLQNQDPIAPMENGDFLAQIAQFSTVSGIQGLQASFEKLSQSLVSNQACRPPAWWAARCWRPPASRPWNRMAV